MESPVIEPVDSTFSACMNEDDELVVSHHHIVDGHVLYYPQEFNTRDMVGDEDFYKRVAPEFGFRILRGTAAGVHNDVLYEPRFRAMLADKQIRHAVEIGTWRGVSAALLAHYARLVTTFDIRYCEEAKRLWLWAGVSDKIKQVIIDRNETKQRVLEGMDFDFAFIDGAHSYDEVAFDFECVKKCGRVLFHDYWSITPDVIDFIDTLPAKERVMCDPFVYWSAKCSG